MTAQRETRHNNFNFLRYFFAILVILSHSPELADGNRNREILTVLFHTISFGELAVDGFFLLSGYLIVQSWVGSPNVVPYIQKRILRIYPGFIIATCVCILIVGPLASNPSVYFSHLWVAEFFQDLVLLQPPISPQVFIGTPYPALNGAMWTIGFEFICYLIVVVLGVSGAIRFRWGWLFITALIFIYMLLKNFGYEFFSSFSLMPAHLACFFFTGGCFYLFRDKFNFNRMGKSSLPMAAILLILMFIPVYVMFGLAIPGGFLIFHFSQTRLPWLQDFNKLPDVSYGVYLYGWPIQKLYLWYFPSLSPWLLFPLSVLTSTMFGLISWHLIEKPCLKFKPVSALN